MNRTLPLLALLLALPASAGDATQGKTAFTAACSQCHLASAEKSQAKDGKESDNLALWLDAHSSKQLRQWVKNPWAVNPKTRCDPRQLKPQDIEDLLSYLRGASAPARSPSAP